MIMLFTQLFFLGLLQIERDEVRPSGARGLRHVTGPVNEFDFRVFGLVHESSNREPCLHDVAQNTGSVGKFGDFCFQSASLQIRKNV